MKKTFFEPFCLFVLMTSLVIPLFQPPALLGEENNELQEDGLPYFLSLTDADIKMMSLSQKAQLEEKLLASYLSGKYLKKGEKEKLEAIELNLLRAIRKDVMAHEKQVSSWARYKHGLLDKLASPFILIGLLGQLLFMSRFLVQWVASEKAKKSVIPNSFWWISLFGSSLVLAYGIATKEPIIILGQFGFIVYMRNIFFIRKEKKDNLEGTPDAA